MSVLLGKTAAGTQRMTERTRQLLTLKNMHLAGVGLLAVVCVYLLAHMAYAWQAATSQDAVAVAQQTVVMQQAQVAAQPLAGLDEKLTQATTESNEFYQRRLPSSYSEVVGELGVLAKRDAVKLTRVQYAETGALEGEVGALSEVRMDASLSGDYRPLVQFINGLERDKMFFVISAMALTGQQSGSVGVRLRITTYLRAPLRDESGARIGPQAEPQIQELGGAEQGGAVSGGAVSSGMGPRVDQPGGAGR
jgi:type IV pilus assembly protein PilO